MYDSHCHLADASFDGDLAHVVDRARDAGVRGALCVLEASSDRELLAAGPLREAWPSLVFAVGVHPHRAGALGPDASLVAHHVEGRLAAGIDVRAVGEIGLDYHYDFAPRDLQRAVFEAQVRLALDHRVPVVVHAREADEDVLEVLRAAAGVRGVMHCFTGDIGLARRVLDLGLMVSLAGIVTFPKAAALRDVARYVPADRLLIETDSPYLAPVPHRGRRNEPAWLPLVAEAVAAARGESREAVAAATAGAFVNLFGLPGEAACVDSPEGLC